MIRIFSSRSVWAVVLICAVLAVGRSGDSAPRCYVVGRFQVVGNTVFDGATGLTWQQTVSPQTLSWNDAGTYCSIQTGGFRLPTLKELQSIVDYTRAAPGPTINPLAFPNTPGGAYWSSTTSSVAGAGAYQVFFDYGSVFTNPLTVLNQVRCVR